MTIKIGYCPWAEKNWNTVNTALNYYGWFELSHYDLEKVKVFDDNLGKVWKCPAFTNYIHGLYVLRSPIDVELSWDATNKVLSTNLGKEASDSFVRCHWGDFDPVHGRPIVALHCAYLFVADQPVNIEFMPPYFEIDNSFRLIPGTFNIFNWHRPVMPTFEMLNNTVEIKRGQPLAYIKFRSENLKESFSLVKIQRTEELEHAVNSCLTLKHFMPNLSWRIQNTFNKLRPKKWLK